MNKEEYYNRNKGCEHSLIKLLLVFVCAFASMALFAQPVKTTANVGMTYERYNPAQPIIINLPTPTRGARGLQGPQGIPGVSDTVFVLPVLDNYLQTAEVFQVVEDQARFTETHVDSIYNALLALRAKTVYNTNELKDNLEINRLRSAGRTKILSGIGLQVAALGVLAFSELDMVGYKTITTDYEVPYTYTEYDISNTVVSTQSTSVIKNRCGRVIGTIVTNTETTVPTITPVTKTGLTKFTTTDQAPCIQERQKNNYYVAAGIMGGVGVVLEVLGIIDLHNANVYVTQNSIGATFKF
jgi:hypothetical protein